MKGFKGFDKDLKCHGMQYTIGETVTHNGEISLCNSGLHFVEHPLDTLSYYKPTESRFAEVEAEGVSSQTEMDSKRVARSLTVKAELKIPALLKAAVEFVFSNVKSSPSSTSTTGYSAHSATTGNYAHSATTGDYAHSATTGNSAQSSVGGKGVIAASLGKNGQAKAAKGGWLVLAEYKNDGTVKSIGVAWVDGTKIKADTFYSVKDRKFIESK